MTIIEPHVHDGACEPAAKPSFLAWFVRSPVRLFAVFVAAILLVDAGGTDEGPGLCVFRRCTGGYCPGCGLTRSAKHLSRGELGAAWHDHPWLVLVAAQMIIAGAAMAIFRRLRDRVDWHRALLVVGLSNVALVLTVWIVRLVDGSIPRFF